jgi:dipeptide/tripeptide permease
MRNLIILGALIVVVGFVIPLLSVNTILKYVSYLIIIVGAAFLKTKKRK